MVSLKLELSGATCMSMHTFAWPDNESASSSVSLLLRKGMCFILSARLFITVPSAERLTLMELASRSRSPVPYGKGQGDKVPERQGTREEQGRG